MYMDHREEAGVKCATVGELRAALAGVPDDKPLTLVDADTGNPGSVWVDVASRYLSDPGHYPQLADSVTIFDPHMYDD